MIDSVCKNVYSMSFPSSVLHHITHHIILCMQGEHLRKELQATLKASSGPSGKPILRVWILHTSVRERPSVCS